MHKLVPAFSIQHHILQTPNHKVVSLSCVPSVDPWKFHHGCRIASTPVWIYLFRFSNCSLWLTGLTCTVTVGVCLA